MQKIEYGKSVSTKRATVKFTDGENILRINKRVKFNDFY